MIQGDAQAPGIFWFVSFPHFPRSVLAFSSPWGGGNYLGLRGVRLGKHPDMMTVTNPWQSKDTGV